VRRVGSDHNVPHVLAALRGRAAAALAAAPRVDKAVGADPQLLLAARAGRAAGAHAGLVCGAVEEGARAVGCERSRGVVGGGHRHGELLVGCGLHTAAAAGVEGGG